MSSEGDLSRSKSCPSLGLSLRKPLRLDADPDGGDVARRPTDNTNPGMLIRPKHLSPAFRHADAARSSLRYRLEPESQPSARNFPASLFGIQTTASAHGDDEKYIIAVCRALMMTGAPTHRLEQYMRSSAGALGIHLDSFYLPGCMILSFSRGATGSSSVHIVRCTEALSLSKLDKVHAVYKAVIHKEVASGQALQRLNRIHAATSRHPRWQRVLLFGFTSLCFGPISYGARPIDMPIIFILATLVGCLQVVVAAQSELYGYVLEITAAILVSLLGRAFGSLSWGSGSNSNFCFSAVSQASIVLLLPGFVITTSALELQSMNMVTGAVRMVYAIIYTLFLAFGFTVGTTIYGAVDGSATSSLACIGEWPFWWQIIFVVPFTVSFVMLNDGTWHRLLPSVLITTAGWVVNHFSAQRFTASIQIPQALGALTVGLLSNLYSRLFNGLAIAIMHPAIYIQVPGSFAASGSFLSGLDAADQLNNRTQGAVTANYTLQRTFATSPMFAAGASMIEIAISIAAGISVSALVIYPFRPKTGKSGLFSL